MVSDNCRGTNLIFLNLEEVYFM